MEFLSSIMASWLIKETFVPVRKESKENLKIGLELDSSPDFFLLPAATLEMVGLGLVEIFTIM